jgi:hypothetical protein
MGVTIAYRGRLADLTRIEDFEDRLLDLALEVGGMARIWRGQSDSDPRRMVRGVVLNLAPGLEPLSLLVAPEGWLIGLTDMEAAERGELTEAPWCWTKTQFGPIEGHVAVVEVLAELGREFLADLEVQDEGGYWEARDLRELVRRRGELRQAIDNVGEALQRHGLSPEAAEDPDTLARRVERIAAQVHAVLRRPPEHPPVQFPDDGNITGGPDPDATEAAWDEMYKHNRRQQERLLRALEERRGRGEDEEAAFEHAMDELALNLPEDDSEADEDGWNEDPDPFADAEDGPGAEDDDEHDAGDDPFARRERHPLLRRAMDLLHEVHEVFSDADRRYEAALDTLFQGLGDAMGGLAQAVSERSDEDDEEMYGLRVVQLKRALRGAAFAGGALFPMRTALPAEQLDDLHAKVSALEEDIFQELRRVREQWRGYSG